MIEMQRHSVKPAQVPMQKALIPMETSLILYPSTTLTLLIGAIISLYVVNN
jgi:hypothetical protein